MAPRSLFFIHLISCELFCRNPMASNLLASSSLLDGRMAPTLKSDILSFLERNPEACDTVEGIATFWVPGVCRSKLLAALDELVEEGQLRRVQVGQRSHFCMASADGT